MLGCLEAQQESIRMSCIELDKSFPVDMLLLSYNRIQSLKFFALQIRPPFGLMLARQLQVAFLLTRSQESQRLFYQSHLSWLIHDRCYRRLGLAQCLEHDR